MHYIVLFEDQPEAAADLRARHLPAHLAFLERHADEIRSAGPLQEPEGRPAGGIWMVQCESPRRVRELVETDPLWPTGLRHSVRILAWRPVFDAGQRLVDRL